MNVSIYVSPCLYIAIALCISYVCACRFSAFQAIHFPAREAIHFPALQANPRLYFYPCSNAIYPWHSKGRMSIMVVISSGNQTWTILYGQSLEKTSYFFFRRNKLRALVRYEWFMLKLYPPGKLKKSFTTLLYPFSVRSKPTWADLKKCVHDAASLLAIGWSGWRGSHWDGRQWVA